ncbi:MAG: tetratricopeptide repeat protein [Gemmatimonadaceae bacterium]
MSTTPPLPDALMAAVAAAQAGDWQAVRQRLDGWPQATEHAESCTLLAEANLRLGEPERARAWLNQVIPLLELRADRAPLRRCVNMLGIACTELGDVTLAEAAYLRALSLAEADSDDLLLARATNNLGVLANLRGDRDAALTNYQLAIPAYQRLGSSTGIAECYHNMAITFRDVRDFGRAEEYALRAIEFARGAANERLAALATLGRTEIIFRRGDSELAGASARRVAEDFARLSDPIREADARRISGLSLLAEGAYPDAQDEIARAVELSHSHGGALVEAESTRALAELHLVVGNAREAREAGAAALAMFERLGAADEVAAMHVWLERNT